MVIVASSLSPPPSVTMADIVYTVPSSSGPVTRTCPDVWMLKGTFSARFARL